MKSWGGAREGAGRKPKPEAELRKNCTLKATSDEWKLILEFARIVKHGDRQIAETFIELYKVDK